MTRDDPRRDRHDLGARVDACWSALHAHLGHLGTVIDSTGPVDRVLADVENALVVLTRDVG